MQLLKSLRLRIALFAVFVLVFNAACQQAPRVADGMPTGSGGVNAVHQMAKPYLVLVSVDGFRWDYIDRYPMPNIDRLVATGSKAERLIPVFPTLTFPNHYSIATGLYPANHGLVANKFPDPVRNKWYSLGDRESVEDRWFYNGEPIWVTAEKQGMVAASFFFVGTEAPIMGISPTHWKSYNKDITGEQRVDQVLAWLAEPEQIRPHLYTLYFEDVDDNAHWYGPDSTESIESIRKVDTYLGRLLNGIERLPYADRVNIILVSDHGQANYLEDRPPFVLGDHIDLEGINVIEGGSYMFLHFERENPERASNIVETVNRHWQHGRAYLPAEAPDSWHVSDLPRFPDVILTPEVGFAVLSSRDKAGKITAGDHGWAPEAPSMHGIFVASGPNISPGISLRPVNAVDIYPLMTKILGLNGPEVIDGNPGKLARILAIGED